MEVCSIKQTAFENYLYWVKCMVGQQNVLCRMYKNLVQRDAESRK